jgi:hypothetical protein
MTLVPLVLDLFDGGLNPVAAGTASLAPSVQLTDPGTGIAVGSGPSVTFRPSNPVPLTWIIPTDASGWAPSGWGWDISFSGVPGSPAAWSFKITSSGYLYSFTATGASPAVFTASGSGLSNGTAVALAPGSSLPGGFRSGQAYYVVNASGDTFSLAAAEGGSALASSSAGSGTAGVVQYLSSLSPESSVTQTVAYAQVNAGDLDGPGGSSASPKVSGIQGTPVSSTAPTSGEVLTYNGSEWVPEAGGSGAVASVFGRTGAVVADSGDYTVSEVTGAAPLASPAFTGTPTAPTASALTDSTQVATTAYADSAVAAETSRAETAEALKAPLASPALTGSPTAPTKSALTDSTDIATTAYADAAVAVETSRAETAEALALPKAGGAMTGALVLAVVTLTDAATIAVNAAAGALFRVTLGGDRTLGTPSNPADGQQVIFEVIQGTGGNFTLAYSAAYAFPAAIPQPSLSSTAGQRDFLSFIYDATETLWQCTGFVPDQNAGIVPVAQGGSGQSTQAAAITALTGTQTSGYYLRSNGTNAALAAIQASDVPTLNQSTSGTAAGLSATLAPGSGGTGQTSLQAAINALAGAVTSGEFLRGNGTNVLLAAIQAADLPTGTTSAQGALQLDGTAGDIQPVGTAAAAGAKGQAADAEHVHPGFFGGIFGNGTDGALTLNGTNTYPGMSLAGSTYTMSRDIQATSITISGGVTLKPANFRILCRGTVTNAGTISSVGFSSSSSAGGSLSASGSMGGGRAGGAGGTGASGAGANGTAASNGNAGGAGGAGTSGTAGAGGTTTVSLANAQANVFSLPFAVLSGVGGFSLGSITPAFGAGGGGGGSDASSNAGGGGGGGGNVVAILAWAFVNTGTVTVAGGNGANGTAGNAGGGGGGAAGAILVYTLSAWTQGTTTVSGGNPGSGSGTGSAGSTGGAGLALNTVLA